MSFSRDDDSVVSKIFENSIKKDSFLTSNSAFAAIAFLLASDSSFSLSFLSFSAALNVSSDTSSPLMMAGLGCSIDPHTGQGAPSFKLRAKMPAWLSK